MEDLLQKPPVYMHIHVHSSVKQGQCLQYTPRMNIFCGNITGTLLGRYNISDTQEQETRTLYQEFTRHAAKSHHH